MISQSITTVHMLVPAEGDGGNNDGAGICVGPRDVKRQNNNNRMKQSSTALVEHPMAML